MTGGAQIRTTSGVLWVGRTNPPADSVAHRPGAWLGMFVGVVRRYVDQCDVSQRIGSQSGTGPLVAATAGVSVTPRIAVGLR